MLSRLSDNQDLPLNHYSCMVLTSRSPKRPSPKGSMRINIASRGIARSIMGDQPGTVTLNQSMAQSYNGSALRLMEKVGLHDAFAMISPFSFSRVTKKDQTYASAVGGFTYGMSPLEMTDAYTSFIDGHYKQSHAILHVKDNQGNILYQWKNEPKKVWSEATTAKLRQMLNEAARTGTGKAALRIKTVCRDQNRDHQ